MKYAKRGSYKEAKQIQTKKKFNEAKRLAEELNDETMKELTGLTDDEYANLIEGGEKL